MQKLLLSCLFAFSTAFISVSATAAAMDEIRAKQIYSVGTKSDYLAGYHYQLTKSCSSCHESDKVSDSQTEIDKNVNLVTALTKASDKKIKRRGWKSPHIKVICPSTAAPPATTGMWALLLIATTATSSTCR